VIFLYILGQCYPIEFSALSNMVSMECAWGKLGVNFLAVLGFELRDLALARQVR
jgi:hypothetical protein